MERPPSFAWRDSAQNRGLRTNVHPADTAPISTCPKVSVQSSQEQLKRCRHSHGAQLHAGYWLVSEVQKGAVLSLAHTHGGQAPASPPLVITVRLVCQVEVCGRMMPPGL